MACNCLCCGCRTCVTGETGKCCCGSSCCQEGETCCSGVCCPAGYLCVDGECVPPTGACCVDGECSETTEDECAGAWNGPGTTCEDGDCAELCCVPEGGCYALPYWNCREGYFAGRCEDLGGTPSESCDTTQTHPGTGSPLCADGGPTSVTVTVSGATATPADFQPVADACNSSFAVDLDCNLGTNTWLVDQVSVTYGGFTVTYYIFVTVGINAQSNIVTATMVVNTANPPGSPPNAFGSAISNQATNVFSVDYTNCAGLDVMDCSNYALPAGNTSYTNNSSVDFSAATIALA